MRIFEYKEFTHNMLLEFAQITNKDDLFYQKYGKVKVYGGGEDGKQKEHNPPHFHIDFNNGESTRVKIPSGVEEDLISYDMILNNKIKKDLKKWFLQPFKMDKGKNNLEAIKEYWNTLNDGDTNVDLIK